MIFSKRLFQSGSIFLMISLFISLSACRRAEKPSPPETVNESAETTAGKRLRPESPGTLALIEADEKAGRLDPDTAWTYRFYRLFEPGRLPDPYRDPRPLKCGTPVFKAFQRARGGLKPETLSKFHAYLVRPDHPDSIFHRKDTSAADRASGSGHNRTGWGSGLLFADNKDRPGNMHPLDVSDKLKLWYRSGQIGKAEEARSLLIEKDMYDRFLEIMLREPPSDALSTFGAGGDAARERALELAGGDGRVDIYLVPPLEKGLEEDHGWCRGDYEEDDFPPNFPCSSYILINQSLSGRELGAALAHELFHAFQHAWDAFESEWWSEGTAVWAEDFIEASWNTEQEYVEDAFDSGRNSLMDMRSEDGDHAYGIYIFPYFLTKVRRSGDDALIGRIWAACPAGSALSAVESELGGDFEDAFKEFALLNLDENLLPGCSENTAGYPEALGIFYEHDTQKENLKAPLDLDLEIPSLGARYLELKNQVPKDRLPHVLFDLRDIRKNPRLTIQAVFESKGARRCEDWSEREERSLCLNFEEEDFDTIYLTIANSHRSLSQKASFSIEVDVGSCFESHALIHFKDTWFYRYFESDDPDHELVQTEHFEATVKIPFLENPFSANPGMALPGLGPYGAATFQGGEPAILHFKAEETEKTKDKHTVKTGTGPHVFSPGFPSKSFPLGESEKSFTLSSFFFCPYYFDVENGEVKFAIIPEVNVVFQWENGKRGSLGLKPVTKKKVHPPDSDLQIPEEFLVTFSSGAHHFGGEGSLVIDNSSGNVTDRREKSFRWEIYRGKSPGK